MLTSEELKRRIDAARTLRGLTQEALSELVAADGLGKTTVGRVERGEMDLRKAVRNSLCEHLDVPAWWFTDDYVVIERAATSQLDRIEAKLDAALAELSPAASGAAASSLDPGDVVAPQREDDAPSPASGLRTSQPPDRPAADGG